MVSSEDGKISSSQNLCSLSPSAKQKAICFVISVRPFVLVFAWDSLFPTEWGFVKFYVQDYYEIFVDIFAFWLNSDINGMNFT